MFLVLQETTTKDGENYDEKFDLDEETAEYVNNPPFWLICFDIELHFKNIFFYIMIALFCGGNFSFLSGSHFLFVRQVLLIFFQIFLVFSHF